MSQTTRIRKWQNAADAPTWKVCRLFGLTLCSDFAFANRLVLPVSSAADGSAVTRLMPGAADLSFTCVAQAPLATNWEQVRPAFSSPWHTEEGESVGYLYQLHSCDVMRFTQCADFYLWDNRIICHLLDPALRYLVEIRLLGPVLSFWLERRGIIALHASAVVVGGQAVAFLASNEGGKSALAAAFMQQGYALLTDDILPVERVEGTLWGRPGYPTMRMWPAEALHFLGHYEDLDLVYPELSKRRVPVGEGGLGTFCADSQPLECIYLPQRRDPAEAGTEVRITPIPAGDAMIELLRYSFTPHVVEALGWQRERLDLLAHVVQHVPLRRLAYPSGFQYLPRVREAVLEDLARLCTAG